MAISKKDYTLIAATFNQQLFCAKPAWTPSITQGIRLMAKELAHEFAAANPNFDSDLFLAAALKAPAAKVVKPPRNAAYLTPKGATK